jgi:hypothetical protein
MNLNIVAKIEFVLPNLGSAIQHGTPAGASHGQPGVTAVVVRAQDLGLGWCLLADQPRNRGVSVTNGALAYAGAVCLALQCDVSDLAWYELDSGGHFDEMHLLGPEKRFAPLLEAGCQPRSLAAFMARVVRHGPGLPPDAAAAVHACYAVFST